MHSQSTSTAQSIDNASRNQSTTGAESPTSRTLIRGGSMPQGVGGSFFAEIPAFDLFIDLYWSVQEFGLGPEHNPAAPWFDFASQPHDFIAASFISISSISMIARNLVSVTAMAVKIKGQFRGFAQAGQGGLGLPSGWWQQIDCVGNRASKESARPKFGT